MIYRPSALDLAKEFDAASNEAQAGAELYIARYHSNASINVETLVLNGRAGQAINGPSSVWGEWDDAAMTLTTDGGIVLRLNGSEVTPLDAAPPAPNRGITNTNQKEQHK